MNIEIETDVQSRMNLGRLNKLRFKNIYDSMMVKRRYMHRLTYSSNSQSDL